MPSEQDGPGEVKSRSGHPKLSRATIVRRKDFTDDLFVQWLGVEGIERPYSIASAAYEPLIELVATVTGVAPYVSMVRQCLHDRATDTGGRAGHVFSVMHGASHCDEFVYDSELRRLSEEHPHVIQYVSRVSRPSAARNAEWNGPVGRINTILEECLERWSPPKEDTVIYLCGNPGMIDDAKARLLPREWSVAQEQYWQRPKRG